MSVIKHLISLPIEVPRAHVEGARAHSFGPIAIWLFWNSFDYKLLEELII